MGEEQNKLTCTACPPGKYKSESGTGKCQDCPKGTYSKQFASVECRKCTGRHFQNIAGQTSCLTCPIGATSSGDGTACLMTSSLIRRRTDSPIFILKVTFHLRNRKEMSCWDRRGSFDLVKSEILSQSCQRGKPPKECFVLLYHNCRKGWFNGYLDIVPDDKLIPPAHACRRSKRCAAKFYSRYLNSVYMKQISPVLLGHFAHAKKSVKNNYLWLCPNGSQAVFDIELGRCFPCPKGHFKRGNRTGHCQKCPVGFFASMNGTAKCKKCPSKSLTKRTGSVSVQECKPSKIIEHARLKGSQFGKWASRSDNGSPNINFSRLIIIGLVGLFLVVIAAFRVRRKGIWPFKRKQKSKQSKVTKNVKENLENLPRERGEVNENQKNDKVEEGCEKISERGVDVKTDFSRSFVLMTPHSERSHTTNKALNKEDAQMDGVKLCSPASKVVKTEVEGEFDGASVKSKEKSTLKFNRSRKVSIHPGKITVSESNSIINSQISREAILNIIDPKDEKDKLMDESNKEGSDFLVQTNRLGKGDVLKRRYMSTTVPIDIKKKINDLFSWENQNAFKSYIKFTNNKFEKNNLSKDENFVINSCCYGTSNCCELCPDCSSVVNADTVQNRQMMLSNKKIPQTMYLCNEKPLRFNCD